jgi:hypothetical protein
MLLAFGTDWSLPTIRQFLPGSFQILFEVGVKIMEWTAEFEEICLNCEITTARNLTGSNVPGTLARRRGGLRSGIAPRIAAAYARGTIKPRTQSQLAISLDAHTWYLLGASPDLRAQIE